MNYKRIISLLEEQLRFSKEQNRQLVEQNNQLLAQNKRMSEQLSAQSDNVFLLTHQVENYILKRFLRSTERGEMPLIIIKKISHSSLHSPWEGLKRGNSKVPSSNRF